MENGIFFGVVARPLEIGQTERIDPDWVSRPHDVDIDRKFNLRGARRIIISAEQFRHEEEMAGSLSSSFLIWFVPYAVRGRERSASLHARADKSVFGIPIRSCPVTNYGDDGAPPRCGLLHACRCDVPRGNHREPANLSRFSRWFQFRDTRALVTMRVSRNMANGGSVRSSSFPFRAPIAARLKG